MYLILTTCRYRIFYSNHSWLVVYSWCKRYNKYNYVCMVYHGVTVIVGAQADEWRDGRGGIAAGRWTSPVEINTAALPARRACARLEPVVMDTVPDKPNRWDPRHPPLSPGGCHATCPRTSSPGATHAPVPIDSNSRSFSLLPCW